LPSGVGTSTAGGKRAGKQIKAQCIDTEYASAGTTSGAQAGKHARAIQESARAEETVRGASAEARLFAFVGVEADRVLLNVIIKHPRSWILMELLGFLTSWNYRVCQIVFSKFE
jgi:hypothetical protein